MDWHFPPQIVPATAEYALSVIVDQHRQQCQFDPEVDPGAVLTFDTTVAQWRKACDLVNWSALGRALNDGWAIHCTDQQWESVLKPPRQRKLRDVCNLIAAHANREAIRPITLFGKPCVTAGAFLTVRRLLRDVGAEVSDIAPSTPLAPFLRRYVEVFLGPISRLAPGALPPVKIHAPLYHAAVLGFFVSWLILLVGGLLSSRFPQAALLGVLAAGIFYALIWIAAKSRPPSVEFGNLMTFRDLASLLARGEAPVATFNRSI